MRRYERCSCLEPSSPKPTSKAFLCASAPPRSRKRSARSRFYSIPDAAILDEGRFDGFPHEVLTIHPDLSDK